MKREPNLICVSVNPSRERGRDYPGGVVHDTKCWIDPGVVRVIYVQCWNGLALSIGRSARTRAEKSPAVDPAEVQSPFCQIGRENGAIANR